MRERGQKILETRLGVMLKADCSTHKHQRQKTRQEKKLTTSDSMPEDGLYPFILTNPLSTTNTMPGIVTCVGKGQKSEVKNSD